MTENRTGTREHIVNQYGREESYLLVRIEDDRAVGITRDGRFQAFKRAHDLYRGEVWVCVKLPNLDEELVWSWAQNA